MGLWPHTIQLWAQRHWAYNHTPHSIIVARTGVFPQLNPSSTYGKAFLYNPTNPSLFSLSLSLSLSLVCYFAWYLVFWCWENFKKQRDIVFFFSTYFGMFFKNIQAFEFFFFFWCLVGAWCLVAEKMWESKGK